MQESPLKRSKTLDQSELEKEADYAAIHKWLKQVNMLNHQNRYNAIAAVLRDHPIAVVDRLLSYFSSVDLMQLLSESNYFIIRSLSALISIEVDGWETIAKKLFNFSIKLLSDYKPMDLNQLFHYWVFLESSIKQVVLKSLEAQCLSSFFADINKEFARELLPCLDDDQWLGLLAHDDFTLCRQLIRSSDLELTIYKLSRLLANQFKEAHQAIIFACFKIAIELDNYQFFESFSRLIKDYIEIVVPLNYFDLIRTACYSRTPDFLTLLLQKVPEYYSRKTSALVATWLSIELTALETETDHLRNSILLDLNTIIQENETLNEYSAKNNLTEIDEIKARILKDRKSQLSDQRKRALLTLLTVQWELTCTSKDLHQHILNRSGPEQHRCIDAKEAAIARITTEHMGYVSTEVSRSQMSQHNEYQRFKTNSFARFDSMRLKTLELEIEALQKKVINFRASGIEAYRRIVMPRPASAEQEQDVTHYVIKQTSDLSTKIPVVWCETLDLEKWDHNGSIHHPIPGLKQHSILASALLKRDPNGDTPMLTASLGFYLHTKGNMTPFVHIPVRFSDMSTVKISPTLNIMTENADNVACKHPVRLLVDYLLSANGEIKRLIKQGFPKERRANVAQVMLCTFDAHTNTIPCKHCQEHVAEIQRSGDLSKKIELSLQDLQIKFQKGRTPITLLFRFSIPSFTSSVKVELLEAKPLTNLTPPNSQNSPFSRASKKKQIRNKENITSLFFTELKTPVLTGNLSSASIHPPRHFIPRYNVSTAINVKVLCKNSVVFHDLKTSPDELDENPVSLLKDYTGLIGQCGL